MLKPMLARAVCEWWAPPRSTSTASTSRRIRSERRFQQVLVEPPSVEAAVAILRGLKERYEIHHGVRIQDAALVAAAVLSDRYLTGRHLPDKAIDLVDEAGSSLRIEIDSVPTEIDVVERRIRQIEIERLALAKETDAVSESVSRISTVRSPTSRRNSPGSPFGGSRRRTQSSRCRPSTKSSISSGVRSIAKLISRRPRSSVMAGS